VTLTSASGAFPGAASAVPEPKGVVMLIGAMLMLAVMVRRRA
jgi:hypothetical protein